MRTARSAAIRRTRASGRRAFGTRVVLYVGPGQGIVSVVAGRRIGGAVARNRARRILREAWRSLAAVAEGADVVLVARPAIAGSTTNDLVSEMRDLLPRTGIDAETARP